MLAYVARRLAFAVGTVLAAVLISFLLVHATDGSPGAIVLGPGATAAEIAAKNAELGWDRPLWTQFFDYLGHLVQVRPRAPRSSTAGPSATTWRPGCRSPASSPCSPRSLSGVVGVVLGVTAAVRGGRLGRFINSSSGVALSLPAFWVGILLVYVLSIQLDLLPATGLRRLRRRPGRLVREPAAAGPHPGRRRRRDRRPHRRRGDAGGAGVRSTSARCGPMGTPAWRIRYVHALRYASVPVVSVLGIQFIALFGGSVIIENLFALPGLGQASQAAAVLARLPGADRRGRRRHRRRGRHQLCCSTSLVAALDPKVRTA